jgi:hypothetical protein
MNAQEHLSILQEASEGGLPIRIDANSDLSAAKVSELILSGDLVAVDASSEAGHVFLDSTITVAGRQRLQRLRRIYPPKSLKESWVRSVPLPIRVLLSLAIALGTSYLIQQFFSQYVWSGS